MKFVPARWFHEGRRKPVRLIVIHCTVSRELATGAEAVAAYFARGERRASAHRTADSNSIVKSVRDDDTAFAAAGANADGLHLELVGLPTQSDLEWRDSYSTAMFNVARPTIREWADEFSIPYRWLTVDQVAGGVTKGFCTHADVSRAFPEVSTGHWDPGPNFPKAYVMNLWCPPSPSPFKDDDMAFTLISPTSGVTWLIEPGAMTKVPNADLDNVAKLPALGEVTEDFFKRIDAGHTRFED